MARKPDDPEPKSTVVAFRNPVGPPVAVPDEVALAAERPYRAYQTYLGCLDWAKVADTHDYPTAAAARADVEQYIKEGSALVATFSKQEMVNLYVAQLAALQKAVWPAAMAGKIPAVKMAMDLVVNSSRLLGLDEMAQEDSGVRTIVIQGETMTADLESAAAVQP